MKLELSRTKIVHPSHNFKSHRSVLGVVSYYHICQRCGYQTPSPYNDPYADPPQCVTFNCTYLESPRLKWEYVELCSMTMWEQAIRETMHSMYWFVKRHQKKGIPPAMIAGTTSVASQAYQQLFISKKLVIKDNEVYCQN